MYPYNNTNSQQSSHPMNNFNDAFPIEDSSCPYLCNPTVAMPTPDFSVNYSAVQDTYGIAPNLLPNYSPTVNNFYPNGGTKSQSPSPPQASNLFQTPIPAQLSSTMEWSFNPQQQQEFSPPRYDNNYHVAAARYEGTVKPNPSYNPYDDATKLYKAMKGFGTDETTLIDILCRRTNQERIQISNAFKTAYGKDLVKDIKSETSGNFCAVLVGLLTPRIEYEAQELRNAIAGAGTDEIALIDIICTKTNAEMVQIRTMYKHLFKRDLEKDIAGDVSGYFRRILVSLVNANRSEAPADTARAKRLAKELYDAGEKRLGTDEVKFNQIFACESLAQLKMAFEEYLKLTGHEIEKAIKSEMSGDVKNAFLAIAQIAKYPPTYYAKRLYKSMKGLGTLDNTLIRNMVLRCEVDMKEIKIEFQKRYGKSLESFIKGDCSGDYKRALLALAGDQHWK